MSKVATGKIVKKAAATANYSAANTKALNTAFKHIANRGVDIGNGFYLIEVKGTAPAERKRARAPVQLRNLPGIKPVPMDEIEHILGRFAHPSAQPKATPSKTVPKSKGVTRKATPQANTSLLAQFAQNESASISRLVESGHLLKSQQLAERLGVSPQAVYKAVGDLRMFSLDGGGRNKLYPAFFADQGLERDQLETVCKVLDHLPGTSKWQFFLTPRLSLSKKNPLDALRKGKFSDVLAAAQAFKEA